MSRIAQAIVILVATAALAGCGSTVQTAQYGYGNAPGPVVTQQPAYGAVTAPTVNPAQDTASARSMTQLTGFVDQSVATQLSQASADQAAGAQFNALQFGRPGAPRAWQGDKGASGQVTVGPYVRVNTRDCREFTHTVTIAGKSYSKQGTACREDDGHWSVVGSSATG